jgi:RNA polymerase sigma factor (sigma-70 family)
MMTDAELLISFVRDRSEDAFRLLLQRHLKLVYGAALRRVNDPALAEDIAQGVFMALARKAHSLQGRGTTLPAWLLTATRFAACKTLRSRMIRAQQEQKAADMKTPSATRVDSEVLGSMIDEAMNRLAGPDRTAIALYYLENRSLREIGDILAVSDDAAQKRVSRALDRLKIILSRRGVNSTADALEKCLQQCNSVVVPPALFTTVLSGVMHHSVASGAAAVISQHILKTLLIKKVTAIAVSTLVVAAVVAAPAVPLVYRSFSTKPQMTAPISAKLAESPSVNTPEVAAPALINSVLDEVPANVDCVFVINNMNGLFGKLASLTQKLNIPAAIPSATTFQTPTKYLDINGPWVGVIPHLPQWLNDRDNNGYAIFHTSNPQKWIAELNPDSSQDGIWLLHGIHSDIAGVGARDGYAAIVGNNYVAIGFSRQELVDLLSSRQSLSDALPVNEVNMLEACDVGYYINVAAIRKPIEQAVDASFAIAPQQLKSMNQSQNQKMLDQTEYGLAIDKLFIHEILDDIKSSVASISISDDGVAIDLDQQFESGTPLADFVTESKPLGDKPFAGLPQINPVYAQSINFSGGWVSELLKTWSNSLANNPDLQSNALSQQNIQEWNSIAQLYQLLHTQATVMSLNPAPNPVLKGFTITNTDAPGQALDLQRQIALDGINIMRNQASQPLMTGQLTQNALTVDGVSFDQSTFNYKFTFQPASYSLEAMIIQPIQNIMGPNGMIGYNGIQDDDLISGVNLSNDELQNAIDAAKNSTDAVDSEPSIVAARQHVLPDASVVIYVQPGAIIQTVLNDFRASTGFPATGVAQIPFVDPVSLSMSADQDGVAARLYLPISALVQTSAQVHQMIPLVVMLSLSQQRSAPQQLSVPMQPQNPMQPPIQPRQ